MFGRLGVVNAFSTYMGLLGHTHHKSRCICLLVPNVKSRHIAGLFLEEYEYLIRLLGWYIFLGVINNRLLHDTF